MGHIRLLKRSNFRVGCSSHSNRRTFLSAGGIMTAAVLGSAALPDAVSGQSGPLSTATSDSMPTWNLGKPDTKWGHLQPRRLGKTKIHFSEWKWRLGATHCGRVFSVSVGVGSDQLAEN